MRSINPVILEGGVCFVVVSNREKQLIEPTRDMGVVMEALGNSTPESEALASTAFEYLTGHRCPECHQATMPKLLCHQCGQCPSCCTRAERHGPS